MADTVIAASLQLDTGPAEQSVKSFKQQLKEAQAESLKVAATFGETSKEALVAAKRVAVLKDQIQDAKETAALFDPGAKFQAFGNVIRTVAGGFTALTGIMAIFGTKSEEVEKTLLQVQAALAFTEGINTILDATKDFQRLNAMIQQTVIFQKANALATTLASGAMKMFGVAVDTTSTSFKVLKGAIVATGIGALIVAIGLVVEALDSWTSAAEKTEEQQKALNETILKGADAALEGQLAFISRQEKLQKAQAEARGASEKELSAIQEYWQKSRLKSQVEHYNEIRNANEKAGQDSLKKAKDTEVDIQITQLQYQKRQLEQKKEHDKKIAEQNKEAAKKAKEEKEQEAREIAEAELKGREQLERLREEIFVTSLKNETSQAVFRIHYAAKAEREQISKEYVANDELRKQLLQASIEKEDLLLKQLREKVAKEKAEKDAERLKTATDAVTANVSSIAEVRKELMLGEQDEFEIQRQNLDKWYKDRMEIVKGNKQLELQVTEEYNNKITRLEQAVQIARLDMIANFLGRSADLFGRQTAAGKTLAIAEATINTYTGATLALRGKVPFPEPFATGVRIAQAALIIGTGLKSIREIVKTQVPGGGGGSVGSIPAVGSSAAAPLTPVPTVTTTQLDAESLNTIGNATSRAYVVEADVTDNQERVARLSRAARLGN